MVFVALISILSVVLGAVLGLLPAGERRFLGPVRTFAFTAALAVCFVTFLPEAFESLGLFAAIPFLAGLGLPILLENVLTRLARRTATMSARLELAYAGLIAHQFADGLSLGSFASGVHAGHAHHEVNLSIAAHTVPIVALVVMSFAATRGKATALARALGLSLAVLAGVGASWFSNVTYNPAHAAVVSAAASGLLLHVVAHEVHTDLPKYARGKLVDLLAAAAGVGILFLGAHEHGEEHAHGVSAVELFADTFVSAAPAIALGALGVAILGHFLRERRGLVDPHAWLGAAIGLETLFLAAQQISLSFALVVALSFIAIAIATYLLRPRDTTSSSPTGFLDSLTRRLDVSASRVLLGIAVAALITLALEERSLDPNDATSLLLATAILTAIGAATPPGGIVVAAVLVSHGFSPAIAMVSLVAGQSFPAYTHFEPTSGKRGALMIASTCFAIGALAAAATVFLVGSASTPLTLPTSVALPFAVALAGYLVARAFHHGTRGLFAVATGTSTHSAPDHAHCDHHHSLLEEIQPPAMEPLHPPAGAVPDQSR